MTLRELHATLGSIIAECEESDQGHRREVPDLPAYLLTPHSKRYQRAIPLEVLPVPGFETLRDRATGEYIRAFVIHDTETRTLIV